MTLFIMLLLSPLSIPLPGMMIQEDWLFPLLGFAAGTMVGVVIGKGMGTGKRRKRAGEEEEESDEEEEEEEVVTTGK